MANGWYSAQELAGLPGMCSTSAAVLKVVKKNLWPSRRKLRGKGYEYPLSCLPKDTQAALRQRELAATAVDLPEPVTVHTPAPVPAPLQAAELTEADRAQGRAARRLVERIDQMSVQAGCSVKAACQTLINRARAGLLPEALMAMLRAARDGRGRPSPDGLPSARSLERWVSKQRSGHDLLPRKPQPDMRVLPWHGLAVALKQRPQKPTTAWVHEQIVAQWNPAWGESPPSYDAVARFFRDKYSRLDVLRGQHQGSALRQFQFYQHRSAAGLAPFVEVHADGWNTHFTAPHPVTGEFVTYEVWHFHDVATRYVTPPSIGLSESFDVIAKGLELCIRVGGVPAVWQTDSTGSVKNDRMKLDPVSSIGERAGIEIVHPETVGNSQANGIPENFNKYLDREARELATYQHPRMDSLAHRRVRKLTEQMVKAARAGDLVARDRLKAEAAKAGKGLVFESADHARQWILAKVERFNHTPHSSLPKVCDPVTGKRRHQTPAEALDEARAAGWQPVLLDEPDIIDLFRPHLRKKVRRGCVSPFGGQRYHHPDLPHVEGEEVMVAVDIMDGASVWVKDLQGRLICQAHFVEATGYRCESMYEYALEKRARAQIRRKENQIERIGERMAPAAIEAPAAPEIDIAMHLYGDAAEPAAPVEPAVTPEVLLAAAEAGSVTRGASPQRRYDDITDLAMYLYGDQIDAEDAEGGKDFEKAAG